MVMIIQKQEIYCNITKDVPNNTPTDPETFKFKLTFMGNTNAEDTKMQK